MGYAEQLQNRPDYLSAVVSKCTYACGVAIDTYLGALFSSLTAGNIGTQGDAIDDDVLLQGVEYLNAANASFADRALIVDVESLTDLMKIDKLVSDSYVQKGAIEALGGIIGKNRYGCTVYMSNNLTAANTSYHYAAMLQKEAIGCIVSKDIMVDAFDWKEKFTNVVRARTLFGASVLRPTAGCCINTRS